MHRVCLDERAEGTRPSGERKTRPSRGGGPVGRRRRFPAKKRKVPHLRAVPSGPRPTCRRRLAAHLHAIDGDLFGPARSGASSSTADRPFPFASFRTVCAPHPPTHPPKKLPLTPPPPSAPPPLHTRRFRIDDSSSAATAIDSSRRAWFCVFSSLLTSFFFLVDVHSLHHRPASDAPTACSFFRWSFFFVAVAACCSFAECCWKAERAAPIESIIVFE